MATNPTGDKLPAPSIAYKISAAVIGLIGLIVFLGGAWLITLGGSWYYLLCGAAIAATAALLFLRKPQALIVYAGVIVVTIVWAVAEIGFDWWQLVPRGDIIFLVGLYLCMPWMLAPLVSTKGQRRRAAAPVLGALAIAAIVE
jgi:quinoprotein glucose dehydrogenase